MKKYFNLWILLTFITACTQESNELPYYNSPDFTPIFDKSKISHQIANFSFKNQSNQTIGNQTVKGKIHVANFFFTSCGAICPSIMSNLATVEKEFQADSNVIFLSFSVTPWIDNPKKLAEYATQRKINTHKWHLLTGAKNEIYTLARKSYFAEEELGFTKDSTDFLHSEHILLIDKNSHIRGIYNGTLALEAEQLIQDIKVLEKE